MESELPGQSAPTVAVSSLLVNSRLPEETTTLSGRALTYPLNAMMSRPLLASFLSLLS